MDQEVPASAGRASFRGSVGEMSVLQLGREMVCPLLFQNENEALSADLATSMAAPRTSTEAEAVSDPSLVVVTLAVLSTGEAVAVAAVVGDDRFTVSATPQASTLSLHDALPISMAQVV